MRRRAILLMVAMVAALVMASGVAMAVNKVCPSGSTFANPCKGTTNNDTLIGTSGPDDIFALSGNDKIAAGAGDDFTNGGAGNDTYSYKDGWGVDIVVDASGVDTLNFSAVSGGIQAEFQNPTVPVVNGPAGELLLIGGSSGPDGPPSVIEKVVGSASGFDSIQTVGATNILQPGPGTGGAQLVDLGGSLGIPASNDTYSGFLASGYRPVSITDFGGTADKLILPFASTDAYFAASDLDSDGSVDSLLIMSTSTDYVYIFGELEPFFGMPGHIETIKFTDGNFSIGSASATTSTSSSATSSSSDSGALQVDALNAVSTLSASKKDELAKATKKILSKIQEAPLTSPEDIKLPK